MRDRVGDSFYCVEHKCCIGGYKNRATNRYGGSSVGYCNNHKLK
jgi:hypothetical protein